jgi:hypothetical protein
MGKASLTVGYCLGLFPAFSYSGKISYPDSLVFKKIGTGISLGGYKKSEP